MADDFVTYLGDGLYCRYMNGQFWLLANHHEFDKCTDRVCLEPSVVKAFNCFVSHVQQLRMVNTPADSMTAVRVVPPAAGAWQPIETAPKDGTMVLFHVPGRISPFAVGRWSDGNGRFEDIPVGWKIEPTHWAPLYAVGQQVQP